MVVRVAQRVAHICADNAWVRVLVATDSMQIVKVCQTWSVEAILTHTDHASGSDRLAQACDLLALPDSAIVVNVQGDEPLIDPHLVAEVARLLQNHSTASISTAAHAISCAADFYNPNVVKVVLDANSMALYFSRAPIAYPRETADHLPCPAPLRHIGIYAYRAGFLRQFPKLAQAPMERTESLEQLRALWHGYRVAVHVTEHAPEAGVDTPEDLARVQLTWAAQFGQTASDRSQSQVSTCTIQ